MPTPRPRSRGTKVPLSLDAVIAAARTCLRRGGPAELTMRKVAAELQTGPGSLYVYVASQSELHVLVLDAIAADVVAALDAGLRPTPADPAERAIGLLVAYGRTLTEHRGSAGLAMQVPATGPASLDLFERLLGHLLDAGFDPTAAARALDPLMLLVTATIAEQDAHSDADLTIAQSYDDALAADPERYPLMSGAHDDIFAGDGADRLIWSLRIFLGGLRAAG